MFQRVIVAAAAAAVVAMLSTAASASPASSLSARGSSVATFNGGQIGLSQGWGDAQACVVDQAVGVFECFRDQAGLLAREAQLEAEAASVPSIALATCSTPLRLYADSNYGGREIDFYDRGYWQNLSNWSFDNQTSSYKVGVCGVHLADGTNGGGSWYPGNTSPGHDEPSMASGWNDRVSSIYIQ